MNRIADIDLTPEAEAIAMRLLAYLKMQRERGVVTPGNPQNATKIAAQAKKFGVEISDVDIRTFVEFLRIKKGELIGSSSGPNGGYAFCLNGAEFVQMCGHLLERGVKAILAYKVPLKRFEERQTLELELQKHPIVKALIEEFECEVVR